MRVNLANGITASRLLLALAAGGLFAAGSKVPLAVVLCLLATATDLVDGIVARKMSQVSNVGGWLDPLADKVVILVIFGWLSARINSGAFWLLYVLLLLRELGMTGLRVHWGRTCGLKIKTVPLGRVKMLVESLLGNGLLVGFVFFSPRFGPPYWALNAAMGAAVLLAYVSAMMSLAQAVSSRPARPDRSRSQPSANELGRRELKADIAKEPAADHSRPLLRYKQGQSADST